MSDDLKGSDLVNGTKHVLDLMSDHVLDGLTCGFQILTGIEMIRMLSEMLADNGCHCKTDIGVDVDLADCEFCSMAKFFFGDADGIGHVSAVLVDDLYEFLRN